MCFTSFIYYYFLLSGRSTLLYRTEKFRIALLTILFPMRISWQYKVFYLIFARRYYLIQTHRLLLWCSICLSLLKLLHSEQIHNIYRVIKNTNNTLDMVQDGKLVIFIDNPCPEKYICGALEHRDL